MSSKTAVGGAWWEEEENNDPLTPSQIEWMQRWLEKQAIEAQYGTDTAWEQLLVKYGTYSPEQVGELNGYYGVAAKKHAYDLEFNRSIFAVQFDYEMHFPKYQFTPQGTPYPIVKELLRIFHYLSWGPLPTAIWMATSNQSLDGYAPADLFNEKVWEEKIINTAKNLINK